MSEFIWLNKQGVELPGQFILQCMDRFYWHYTEGESVYRVTSEGCHGKKAPLKGHYELIHDVLIEGDLLNVSSDEKKRILSNVATAFQFMNIKYSFESVLSDEVKGEKT